MKDIEKINFFRHIECPGFLIPFSTTQISSRDAKRRQEFTNNVIQIQ